MVVVPERLADSWAGAALILAVAALGLLSLARALLRLLSGVWVYFLRPGKNVRRYGPWAVVTGATDGIGRAYADALAKKGLNVVLISRTKEKLEAAAAEIQQKFGVQTRVVPADFGSTSPATWAAIQNGIAGLDVGLLVNNVGLSYDHAEYLDAVDDDRIDALIAVNVQATNKVTKLVLPGMKARRGPSAIVNIGSAAATIAPSGPLYAVYAGTKAYVDMFSKSLNLEYASAGISVQNQAPMYVATKMSKIRRPTLDAPSPARWVASAVAHIGYEATCCPYWYHGLMWGVVHSLPTALMDLYLLRFHKDLRARWQRKQARAAKAQ